MPDREDVRDLMRGLPLRRAPEGMWQSIEAALRRPAKPVPFIRRPMSSPLLAAAALLVALLGGAYIGVLRSYGAPSRWDVMPLAGTPTVAGAALLDHGGLSVGEWLVTDDESRAELTVGRIGVADVGPNSRVRLDRGGLTDHRLTLERGSLSAVIAAPPRLFFVRTPAALATDLGCAYTLEVDSAGTSRIHVTAGWVELRQGSRISLVPAGLVAEVGIGRGPGTPYPDGFPAEARAALHRLDRGTGTDRDLALVFAALHTAEDYVTLRRESGITLWHLLQRLDGAMRERVYRRLAELAPPPAGVTREGILALQRPMLESWRRDLNPMWSEEAETWLARAARQLWNWTVR
ncbi:MAG: hypothetical protein ACE5PT_08670 [Gemmatimonadales bacterium]